MRKNLIIILVLLLLSSFSIPLSAGVPQTQEGAKSVFWGFNGLSNLSVDNTWIGGQYLFADKMGIWAAVGLSFLTEKPTKDANDNIKNDFEFDVGFIYYVLQKGPIACWLSPQVGIGFGSEEFEDIDTPKITISKNMFYAGISIGVEWWFADNISLSADTFFGFQSDTKTIEAASQKVESSYTQLGILSGADANLVLLFYF